MNLDIPANASTDEAFFTVENFLKKNNLNVSAKDQDRPWGGFFYVDEKDTDRFIKLFFHDISLDHVKRSEKLSPKVLLVKAGRRLSWQYHHRRSEIWKVISGTVAVAVSDDDQQPDPEIKSVDDVIILENGERHRLIGTEGWGVVAEIWQHSNPDNPSNEEDIVRLQDDFGR